MNIDDLLNDVIDVRDLIARFEELENEWNDVVGEPSDEAVEWMKENGEEFKTLKQLLEELEGNGGDEQWRGAWYPLTLISANYFTSYCKELCEDIGDIPRDIPHYIEIDWEGTAQNIKVDYVEVTIDGHDYLYR